MTDRPGQGMFVRKLATAAVRSLYRRVEVYRAAEPIRTGPEVVVSNHFGGFADPLLLLSVSPRVPRILARDKIWEIPVIGWVMKGIGAIPVHKPEDGSGSNDAMFGSAYRALEAGDALMIFPEGITRDEPSIAPIKSGAARIVLGARSRGVQGIAVTPAGIHYEDKAALRSSVSIHIGRHLSLDAEAPSLEAGDAPLDADNRPAVRQLTDTMETRLRRVSPDFADWREARALTAGAEILLRALQGEPATAVSGAHRDVVAGHLARRPPEAKRVVVDAVEAYERDLAAVGMTDAQFAAGVTGGQLLWYLAGWLLLMTVLAPFAAVGLVINLLPALVVKATNLIRAAPAVLATIKPIAAVVAFGIAWSLVIWSVGSRLGFTAAAAAAILLPVYGWAVIFVSEHVVLLWRAFRAWRGSRSPVPLRDRLAAERQRVLDATVEAL